MPSAIAIVQTPLKLNPVDSQILAPSQKIQLAIGQEFFYTDLHIVEGNHYKIQLASPMTTMDKTTRLQTVYGYAPHLKLQGSQEIRLPINWDDQVNSRYPQQALRMCFSCSVWMCMCFVSKSFAKKFIRDDDYLNYMLSFGDTTDSAAHVAALKNLGFKAQFTTGAGFKDMNKSLEAGLPCAIGVLHHGTVDAPSGGGHWIAIGGVNAGRSAYLAFDPYGSLVENIPYSGAVENGNGYYIPSWVLEGRWLPYTHVSDGYLMTFYDN